VSLIENALEKMRRNRSAEGRQADPASPRELAAASSTAAADRSSESSEAQRRRLAVDWDAVRAAGYLPDPDEAHRFADHYRQIKRPLIDRALARDSAPDARLILLSSALPGDGKTFTAVNLALSMARERDVSVLLVDADLPRSRISQILGMRGEPGLVDALETDSHDVESYVVHTNVEGLDVLPAGETVESATELLASARMEQIAARLVSHNPRRLVLFDSAPLLGSSEARALVKIPGQIVLVVRAGVTPRQAILDAVAHLDASKLQGLILNESTTARGSGYYYGYSSYGSVGKESARKD
jgi:protein-tyrosine kinase